MIDEQQPPSVPASINVLVLCTHNSARSQMAEALLRTHGNGRFLVASAGTEATRVNPFAVDVMRELGVDISGARSKHLDEFIEQEFDYVITVCDSAAESCPMFPGRSERIHWSFPDPSAATGSDDERRDVFRSVRDDIASRIQTWISEERPGR
ncbi:MAG: arsenate reductase ArsC [Sphaerobacteraceae bacterium]|nr:MAG: arsenate reductase ArsC [Sphaerobacteraceae bacterium]